MTAASFCLLIPCLISRRRVFCPPLSPLSPCLTAGPYLPPAQRRREEELAVCYCRRVSLLQLSLDRSIIPENHSVPRNKGMLFLHHSAGWGKKERPLSVLAHSLPPSHIPTSLSHPFLHAHGATERWCHECQKRSLAKVRWIRLICLWSLVSALCYRLRWH